MAKDFDSALAKVRAVAHAPEEEQLFMAAEAGESLERALADPAELTKASKRFIEIAYRLGCSRVYGASNLGQRLAGAAVALSGNGLKDHTAGLNGQSVLIVDGLLVTGAQVAHAARSARDGGAATVCAAVVACVETDPARFNRLADTIEVLEP